MNIYCLTKYNFPFSFQHTHIKILLHSIVLRFLFCWMMSDETLIFFGSPNNGSPRSRNSDLLDLLIIIIIIIIFIIIIMINRIVNIQDITNLIFLHSWSWANVGGSSSSSNNIDSTKHSQESKRIEEPLNLCHTI